MPATPILAGLTPEQNAQFVTFLQLCTEEGALARPEGLEIDDCDHGISDPATLLRFLTARQFECDAALDQLRAASKFRSEKQVLSLFDTIEISEFEQTQQLYPHWTGRRDKQGLPICFFDLAKLDKASLACWEETRERDGWSNSRQGKPDMLQLASVFHDGLTRFVLPLCTMMTDRPDLSAPVTSSVYLVDASTLGLKQGWALKTFAQEISWLLSTCYPETITRVYVCNAPSYFASIWKYLKKWVDPNTAQKIVVLTRTEVSPTLQEQIDPSNIPDAFGGEFQFEHGMAPAIDDDIRACLNWTLPGTSLPPGPIKLSEGSDGTVKGIAVGSLDGVQRREMLFISTRENSSS